MNGRMQKQVQIVIGANYGDEGKGLMTDYFARKALRETSEDGSVIVVCSNGGAQRGHTVMTESGERHVFHHFGSGTLAGAHTFLCRDFIVNPILFREEYEILQKGGHTPKVFMDPACLWSTPYDMMINQIAEESRGTKRHGSCGLGIWETVFRSRKAEHPLSVPLPALNEQDLRAFLKTVRDEYLPARLENLGIDHIPACWQDILHSQGLIDHYIEDVQFMLSRVTVCDDAVLGSYCHIIFENGQGLLLDQNQDGCKDHTTPSNTGLKNPLAMLKKMAQNADLAAEICYVTRTYMTRHGAGPFPAECPMEEINPAMVDLTNRPNPFQGTLRYGKLSEKALAEQIRKDLSMEGFYVGECPEGKTAKELRPEGLSGGTWRLRVALTHTNEVDQSIWKRQVKQICRNMGTVTGLFDGIYTSDGEHAGSVSSL